jgi:hypothetical protein
MVRRFRFDDNYNLAVYRNTQTLKQVEKISGGKFSNSVFFISSVQPDLMPESISEVAFVGSQTLAKVL